MERIAVVGAGITGSVIANELASNGFKVDVYDKRVHIGGNCYTEIDEETNIVIHKYGPHIFHTDNEEVWSYITSFLKMNNYVNRVKCIFQGAVYSLPINLHTINQLFNVTLSPQEAKDFIKDKALDLDKIESFEDQALSMLGEDIYRAFFYGYTKKQWGVEPRELPAAILKRLPVRFNYNDNYFNHKYQGIPQGGYTKLFEKLLDHPNIHLTLESEQSYSELSLKGYQKIFWTGPLDEFFSRDLGPLSYRTLVFEKSTHLDVEDYQGNAVVNYCDESVPWTRITEHKHFDESRRTNGTVTFKEFSKEWEEGDIEYYPKRLLKDKKLLDAYQDRAKDYDDVVFAGRLGLYKYMDMDVSIKEALEIVREYVK